MKEKVSTKTWGQNAKAQMAYREIKRIEKDFWDDLKKRGLSDKLQKDMLAVIEKEKLDEKGTEVLKLLLGQERPVGERERIELAIDEALRRKGIADQQIEDHRLPLFLNRNGDLYRNPKEKYCYTMKTDGMRFKILTELVPWGEIPYPSKGLQEAVSAKSEKVFHNAIGVINREVRKPVGLQESDKNHLIISKNGYLINPAYHLQWRD